MDNKKSDVVGKTDDAAKEKQTSSGSKCTIPCRRNNKQMVQNLLLIWLDSNIDDSSTDCRNTITQLRRAVNSIDIFTNSEECIEFLDNIGDENACMIISGSLGRQIMPRVHDMSEVDSIFIFCCHKDRHEQWVKEWPKIKGVFTAISPICEALKQAAQQCEQNAIPISFMATNDDVSKKNLDQLDCSFMYTQILKEILLTIKFEEKHFTQFIEYCCDMFDDNEGELKNVKRFETKYHEESPIWWYTYDCFLYPMLNRALRLMDVDVIIKLGFFIDDLHRHIEQLHSTQFADQNSGESFKVYRGQGMSKTEFEQMSKVRGGLIAFNNFLSTSKNRKVSLDFANSAVGNPDLVGILFVMIIDPSQSTTPFASIVDISYFKDKEDEVLFAMHTVFRICDIKPLDENQRLFRVELTLTSDNDKDLRQLTDRIREEVKGSTGWNQLGELLLKMGQSKKAEQVYEILLEQTTKECEKAHIYYQLGKAKDNLGEYKESIIFHKKALAIRKQLIPPKLCHMANSYNSIGNAYDSMGEYSEALWSHGKALEIRQQLLPPNHLDLATSYNSIGNVYDSMSEYSKALSSHEKALEIRQQSLPPNHPELASSYNNIGAVYQNMGEYSKALSSHKKALAIRKQSLPSNHPSLAFSYCNIGNVYCNMGEYSKALSCYENTREIFEKTLPSDHPDLALSYGNIGLVYENMDNYAKARSFYEHAVDIAQYTLPSNHPKLQKWRSNIDRVKKKL